MFFGSPFTKHGWLESHSALLSSFSERNTELKELENNVGEILEE